MDRFPGWRISAKPIVHAGRPQLGTVYVTAGGTMLAELSGGGEVGDMTMLSGGRKDRKYFPFPVNTASLRLIKR
ncbi:hypothetical protein PACILC2_35080 [Paenibacillus cisolokensis]|jgi:hypothetical protein|uniref:Uncharacterized protein n=1 Tax=Paenibacillus cisolokensis TaxID=1658519 RepID=A0ABQ4N9S9_9BACL|nr:hypothetical protein [Paenibacillus cisolokensis]GIQ64940.1 hypothetical protein PACILC2_35080 [Paenibacillus cisolokensis]